MECCTCLASGVRLIKLDATSQSASTGKNGKMTLLDCLLFCTHIKNVKSFSGRSICIECSRALEISFVFIKNAITANAIFLQRASQSFQQDAAQMPSTPKNDQLGAVKFRCKICQEKLDSKGALKNHVKLHMDVITYRCQQCDFDCKKRTHLNEHYIHEHNIEATSEQLKPVMQQITKSSTESRVEEVKQDYFAEIEEPPLKSRRLMRLEARIREDAEAQRLLKELEESLSHDQPSVAPTTMQVDEDLVMQKQGSVPARIEELTASIISEDTSISNEFVMLPDGSVQKVDGAEIVIEYIDEEVVNIAANESVAYLDGNDLVIDNTVQIDESCNMPLSNLDFENIEKPVEENPYNQTDASHITASSVLNNEPPTTSLDTFNKQNYCKICNQVFGTRSELKIHMLSHSEIPHFFCDRCSFYTFFKNDLTQHYKSKHHVHPSSRQLQPKNKNDSTLGVPIYSCDLCFYESAIRLELQHHYMRVHKVEANEVQLRPTVDNTDIYIKRNDVGVDKCHDFSEPLQMPISKGVACKLCKNNFATQRDYREHLLWHKQEKKNESLRRLLEIDEADIEKELEITSQDNQFININMEAQYETATVEETVQNPTETPTSLGNHNVVYQDIEAMHIENNVILPMEAIPQVIGSEQTITPDGQINFEFSGDDIFGDFENANGNNDEKDDDLGNLVLTSEDDLDDLIKPENGNFDVISNNNDCSNTNTRGDVTKQQLSGFCVQCNKHFFSQYQFENHMFIHRGLAPYSCEMCTNIYNTKRALIKHYRAVHKRMPTRDMIQAKGDRVDLPQFDITLLNLDKMEAGTLMCAKCPFETTELLNIQLHLSNTHGITDQLPFECPRCIRSFETKSRLTRHLERNHSTQLIYEQADKTNHINATPSAAIINEIPLAINHQEQIALTQTDLHQHQYNFHQEPTAIEAASSTTSGKLEQQQQLEEHTIAEQQQSPTQQLLWQHQQEDFNNLNIVGDENPTTTTTNEEDSFVCQICLNKYKSATLLKFHMKRHIERKFLCQFCPKSFITRSDLDTHTSLHSGNLRYKCDICDKKFGYSHHLKRHRDTIHFGKRFFCPMVDCGKVFHSRTQLTLHRREHDGTKPFKCPHCQRVFNRREYFRKHALKRHNIRFSEAEIAEVYRATTGYCNPHDLLVVNEGQFLRRSDIETLTPTAAIASVPVNHENLIQEDEFLTEEAVNA